MLGTGLGAATLAGIFAVSVALFVFWDVPLWRTAAGASHVGRIAVSYLIVLPLVAGALALRRRWSFTGWLTGVGLLLGAKLVVTATLYYYVIAGAAPRYAPARAWEGHPAPTRAPRTRYRPSPSPAGLVDVSGVITNSGAPVARAAVWIHDPPPGLPLAGQQIDWTIRDRRHDAPVRVATTADKIFVSNQDPVLHTVRFTAAGRPLWNLPVPPGAPRQAVATPPPGTYELSCENHPGERAVLVVVDHPYIATSDEVGRFALPGAPGGARELVIVGPAGQPVRRPLPVSPGASIEIGK